MTTPFRWGILGTGNIAKKFAQGLAALPDAQLAAVGSRSEASATAFATEFKVLRSHGSYEALAGDPDVDAIYVASPHPLHREHALLCLDHGKAVLCEKPFTVNLAEAKAVVTKARRKKLFCMEAMWTRFLPVSVQVRQWLADHAVGEVRLVTGDFGFRCGWNPESRLLDPKLGGGALLDVGCYALAYARMVMGAAPKRIQAAAAIGATKVDEQVAMLAQYGDGRLATLVAAVRTNTTHDLWIYGTEGRIHVPKFWCARSATLWRDGKEALTVTPEFTGNGYHYQAAEVAACVRAGRTESAVIPLAESLELMATMDEVRRQIGLVYPMDAAKPKAKAKAKPKAKAKAKAKGV